ncbi:hypothetical protein AXX17_AT3G30740 [Arabidopsis thaliana]|uniref:Uncharacterized protein n=1 Tax=Arabidopsis thaliana TaxID=3702 RepID=A0A178VM44_ARATH|nr:hypothetical protein AXX17_AT3G30740 [Arabidopsis thaliana]
MQTLTTIGGVAAAMGPTVKKASKHMREFALAVVDKMVVLAGLSDFVDATHLLKPAINRSDDQPEDLRKIAEGCQSEI